jgi:AraC-like DNA-binding protein
VAHKAGLREPVHRDDSHLDEGVRPEWLFELVNKAQALVDSEDNAANLREVLSGLAQPVSNFERELLTKIGEQAVVARMQLRARMAAVTSVEAERCNTDEDHRKALRAAAILESEYKGNCRIESVARRVGSNRTDLESEFRRALSYSVHSYLTLCRVCAAKKLLNTTYWSVAAIAREVGYRSKVSFYRNFRRVIGVSPDHYRRRWRLTQPNPRVLALRKVNRP